jgi:predicted glycoside hydrolase/deacetylase ChbG (UPF0249 family)
MNGGFSWRHIHDNSGLDLSVVAARAAPAVAALALRIDRLGLVERLIINADDFGLTAGVNRAIVELHQAGVLTSTTLMANASASDEAIQLALGNPSLGVGCHIVLLDGSSVLSPRLDIPNLADPVTGQFRASLLGLLDWLYRGSRRRWPFHSTAAAEIEAEATAQIRKLQSRGLPLTHIDTHKHTHMFPAVLRPLLRAARSCGITRIRNPFEPAWSVGATPNAPVLRRAQVKLLQRALQPAFRRIVTEEGFTTTDGAIGVLATGTLDTGSLESLLQAVPDGDWELVTHPGYYDDGALDAVRTRLRASRETERTALEASTDLKRFKLINFADLAPGDRAT